MSGRAGYGPYLSFPFQIASEGRPARTASLGEHVRDELIQLVLTGLGERLFLPELGGNVRRLLFERNDETSRSLAKTTLTEAVRRWLGHRVVLEEVDVQAGAEGTVEVSLRYRLAGETDVRVLRLTRPEDMA